jgi:hypothetical protein
MLKKSASDVLALLRGSTYRNVRLASSLAAALLDGLFEHPARLSLSCPRLAGHRRYAVPKWFLVILLAAGDPFLAVRPVQMIEDIVGFRQHHIPILEDRNIVLA